MVTPNSDKHFQMLSTYKKVPGKTFSEGPIYSLFEIILGFQERGVLNISELKTALIKFLSQIFLEKI